MNRVQSAGPRRGLGWNATPPKVAAAQAFAAGAHVGQQYNGGLYTDHLADVVRILTSFGFTEDDQLCAGWLHDVVEDTAATVDTVADLFGDGVAGLVWACTGVGDTRAQRTASIYRKIAASPEAAVVKLADRIANVEAAAPDGRHLLRYRAEAVAFEAAVRPHVPGPMWARLVRALGG